MLSTASVPGAPNWLDLGTPDVDAARAFYHAVFGWAHRAAEDPQAGGYGFFLADGQIAAGVGPRPAGTRAEWNVYFHTPDADATAKAVEQAGGAVRSGPADILTHGRTAAFADPAGADFLVWQPGDLAGLAAVGSAGTLLRTELYTTDAQAAKDFYRAVFSWQYTDMAVGDLTYTLLTPATGGPDAVHGGLMQLPQANLDAGSTPEWHPYFAVDDCDAAAERATGAGASALIPPTDAGDMGRFAMFLDPAGAVFALQTPPG